MKIYTKAGDKGFTSFIGKNKIPKNHPLIDLFGTVDELNALVGAVVCETEGKIASVLQELQAKLLCLGADLAAPRKTGEKKFHVPEITATDVTYLERVIDEWDATLPKLKNFILPGGSRGASLLHVARAVCRRAERKFITAAESEPLNPQILIYLNRLSDLLFVMARVSNFEAKNKEVIWQTTK